MNEEQGVSSEGSAPEPDKLVRALTATLGNDQGKDLLATVADAGLDAAIESGALDGIPIFGVLTKFWRSGKDVRQALFIRKTARFLQELYTADPDDIRRFSDRLKQEGKAEEFGETILLILERLDDAVKPGLVGRIMAAHVRGEIRYAQAMRLAAIIARSYITDLEFLKEFQRGTQGEKTPIAESLFAAGVLSNGGIDGGTFDSPGGTIYYLNEYGELLLRHALAR